MQLVRVKGCGAHWLAYWCVLKANGSGKGNCKFKETYFTNAFYEILPSSVIADLSIAGLLQTMKLCFINVIKYVISVILNRLQDISLRCVEYFNLNNLLCSRFECFNTSPFIPCNTQNLNEYFGRIRNNSHDYYISSKT
jgi:hypothetical protein